MSRGLDAALVALLVVALVEAGLLLARARTAPRLALPMTAAGPGIDPAGADRAVRASVVAVGAYVTVEDLARGVLALERGALVGAAPLSAAERAEVAALVAQADLDRRALLDTETRLRAVEAELDARARAIAASLTPEQRAWVLAERDRVSVGRVEAAYWAALAETLAAEPR